MFHKSSSSCKKKEAEVNKENQIVVGLSPPNFDELHRAWNEKLEKGKASAKKPPTKVKEFHFHQCDKREKKQECDFQGELFNGKPKDNKKSKLPTRCVLRQKNDHSNTDCKNEVNKIQSVKLPTFKIMSPNHLMKWIRETPIAGTVKRCTVSKQMDDWENATPELRPQTCHPAQMKPVGLLQISEKRPITVVKTLEFDDADDGEDESCVRMSPDINDATDDDCVRIHDLQIEKIALKKKLDNLELQLTKETQKIKKGDQLNVKCEDVNRKRQISKSVTFDDHQSIKKPKLETVTLSVEKVEDIIQLLNKTRIASQPNVTMSDPNEHEFIRKVKKDIETTSSFLKKRQSQPKLATSSSSARNRMQRHLMAQLRPVIRPSIGTGARNANFVPFFYPRAFYGPDLSSIHENVGHSKYSESGLDTSVCFLKTEPAKIKVEMPSPNPENSPNIIGEPCKDEITKSESSLDQFNSERPEMPPRNFINQSPHIVHHTPKYASPVPTNNIRPMLATPALVQNLRKSLMSKQFQHDQV